MEGLAVASQILKGCSYLAEALQNTIDAPRESRLLLDELSIIEEIVRKSPEDEQHLQALNLCNERLSKVSEMMSKFTDLEHSGRCRKWQKQISMALSTDLLQKQLTSLREARACLESAQNKSISASILDRSGSILSSVDEISTSQHETARITSQADHKLDDIHNVTQETQRVLQELAERFVLLETKAKIWAQQNEQIFHHAIEKSIRDNFELLLPALASLAQANRPLELGSQNVSSEYHRDWDDTADFAHIQGAFGVWEDQPRIVELPDHFSLEAASWNQKDCPPYIEKRDLDRMPAGRRFLRFNKTPQSPIRTKCLA